MKVNLFVYIKVPSWSPSGDPCLSGSWKGVTCDSNGYITQINLFNSNLNYNITNLQQVFSLTKLTQLEFGTNQLTGVTFIYFLL